MIDSCCSSSLPSTDTSDSLTVLPAACPTNHKVGKAADTLILKAMLSIPLTQVVSDSYFFCPDPTCPTVYYSRDGQQLFTESHLREKVYQKHPTDETVMVCYCFQHTLGSIRDEMSKT